MTPFSRAYYPAESLDPKRYERMGMEPKAAQEMAQRMSEDAVWRNDVYQVAVRAIDDGIEHLSIKRIDRAPIHDWRDLQWIKNQLCGPEREAIEIYPAEKRKVDTANQYHLWVFPEGFLIPLGFADRLVQDRPEVEARNEEQGLKAQQRAFRAHDK